MPEISPSSVGPMLTCDLCGSRCPAQTAGMRGRLNFCQPCTYERSEECLARLKASRPKSRWATYAAGLVMLCLFAGVAWMGIWALDHADEIGLKKLLKPAEIAESKPEPEPDDDNSEPVTPSDPAPKVAENTEAPWIQRLFTDRSQRSVADVGHIHLLFVRQPGTDSRMGISSRVFGTREAPSKESAKLISEVGPQMASSFEEGLRYVRKLPRNWEGDFSIRLSFEDKYTKKDGGSAATAFTLVMLSAIQGFALDPEVAVTGDLTIDGTVQPVGGVVEKVRGAIDGKCKITLIPERNSRDVIDLALLHGTTLLWETQIFSIDTIDQALGLARRDRAEDMKSAIDRFNALRARLPAVVTPNYLQSPIVQTELKEVLRAAPNHLSAATLLGAAENKLPKELSLNRSVEEILVSAQLFIGGVLGPVNEKSSKSSSEEGSTKKGGGITVFPEREYGEWINKLQRITPILDRRSLELKTTCVAYASSIRSAATYKIGDLRGVQTRNQFVDWVRKEKGYQQQAVDELNESKSRFMLALRKLDTDGSLMSELRKR